jgi:predicted methyltransferase
MRGAHRSLGAADRDRYRHPVETLAFFGLTPTMTVLDVGAAPGYYTELLAPALATGGLYLATNPPQPSTAPEPSTSGWSPYAGVRFDELLRASPALYGKVQVVRVDYEKPKLNLDGQVDLVLLMREVHMMHNWGTFDAWLKEIHRALKPTGIVGVVDHRAAPGTSPPGYVQEAWVIEKFESAGFRLAGRSEINANPKDTKDWVDGVWTLPPTLSQGDKDRDRYLAIGEADNFVLKFRKPKH